jgi:serine/threonine protein kinase
VWVGRFPRLTERVAAQVRGKECAIKKLKGQDLSEEALEEMRKEVKIMSELYHPNIVLLMGVCFRKGAMAMVTELMPEGSVSDLLRNPKANISLLQKLQIARDTSLGMNWLHTRNPTILHRDLKPANLLMDKDWNVKVCDFGLSTAVERGKMWEDEDDIPGTPLWMAPEVMLGKALGTKSDVYSFGLCLWEFFSCQEPYQAFTNFNDFRKAVCFKFERPKLVAAPACPEVIQKLIVRCWDSEPNVRPSFTDLLQLYPSIFLECMIADEKGKQFWQSAFYHDGLFPSEVGWDQFAPALAKYLGLADSAVSDTAMLCLKALIAESSRKPGLTHVVTMGGFGEFLQEFGPLQPRQSAILTTLEELSMYKPKRKQPSHVFHGNLSSAEAEKRLAGQDKGTWLVRVSAKDPKQPFVISKVSRQGAINHQRINYDADARKYKLEIHLKDRVKTAESEGSLVEFLKSLKEDLYLKAACPGSQFGSIYNEATIQGYLPS